jgi:acyl-CoA synthetase (AMP-forming)/AMP-acid ligase II
LILSRAAVYGEKTALVDPSTGIRCSFTELSAAVREVAAGLTATGFGPGDVIALISPNSVDYAVAFLGAALAGGVCTTLNPTSTPEEIEAQARDSGASVAFTVPELLDRVRPAGPWRFVLTPREAPGARSIDALRRPATGFKAPLHDPRRDLLALPYSSGTTGISKGVCLTHGNVIANLHQIALPIFRTEDVILGLAPFFHIYGLTVVLLLGLFLGATDVILPRFDIQSFAGAVEAFGVTHANLVPPVILALARHASIDPARLATLGTVQSGAAPLPAETARAFANRFGCRVLQGYGLTETSPVTHVSPRQRFDIPVESIGPPVEGTECRIRDFATGRSLEAGAHGELYIRGPQVMTGYLNAPGKTREVLDAEGWLRTGDIAWADRDGNFYIVDRVKELIKYKAFPVAPAELEALLISHPDVSDAAVVPSPDPDAGESPKAYVDSPGGVAPGVLMSWVAERVAPHKRIRQVEFIDEIPRSASGKILRRTLIERERELARERQSSA